MKITKEDIEIAFADYQEETGYVFSTEEDDMVTDFVFNFLNKRLNDVQDMKSEQGENK